MNRVFILNAVNILYIAHNIWGTSRFGTLSATQNYLRNSAPHGMLSSESCKFDQLSIELGGQELQLKLSI